MPNEGNAAAPVRGLHRTAGPEETMTLGSALAEELRAGDIVLLTGELGGGKTHFVKGMALGLGHRCYVKSPSFTIVNIYGQGFEKGGGGSEDAPLTLYHMDLYRVGEGELFDLGLEEYLFGDGVSVVEWAEKAPELSGEARFVVSFTYVDESLRDIDIKEFLL